MLSINMQALDCELICITPSADDAGHSNQGVIKMPIKPNPCGGPATGTCLVNDCYMTAHEKATGAIIL